MLWGQERVLVPSIFFSSFTKKSDSGLYRSLSKCCLKRFIDTNYLGVTTKIMSSVPTPPFRHHRFNKDKNRVIY